VVVLKGFCFGVFFVGCDNIGEKNYLSNCINLFSDENKKSAMKPKRSVTDKQYLKIPFRNWKMLLCEPLIIM